MILMGSVHSKGASMLKGPFKKVMLKETVDGKFTTVDDVAAIARLFAAFPSNAPSGQSLVVSRGWFMQ